MPRLNCRSIVKRCVASLGLIAAAALAGSSGAHAAAKATVLCVGGPRCYPTVQSALDASENGDTIKVGPGTFAGGITITKSISLIGSGAGATVVRGGGPVITIGQSFTGPTLNVSIARLTITGGVNTTTPVSFDPFGGGVLVNPTAAGATNVVTISDSVVTGNSSGAEGGGIADIGQLTLTNSIVSSNEAGSAAGQRAKGGGIWTASPGGTGSLDDAATTSSLATSPKRTAVTISVSKAAASRCRTARCSRSPTASSVLTGQLLEQQRRSDRRARRRRGIHVGDGGYGCRSQTPRSATTSLLQHAPLGEPTAASVGLVVGASPLVLTNSTISGNRVVARRRLDRRSRTERQRLRVRCERDDLERSRRRTTAPRSRSHPGSQVRPVQFFPSTRIRRSPCSATA